MSELTQIDSVGGVKIYSVTGEPKSFIFKAGFAVDADGAPDCYGPDNSGIDYTANGGQPGSNWWGGPTDANGYPLKQQIYDPSPGMYVCATAHCNPVYTEDSQYRYIDSSTIPFIVLPGNHSNGAQLGDVCLCYNEKTGDNCYAIYADVGPSAKIGEGSMRLAEALNLSPSPKTGGTQNQCIVYLVFPGSVGAWKPPKLWWAMADVLVAEWGSLARLKKLIPQLGREEGLLV